MSWRFFNGKLDDNYVWEFEMFYNYRSFKDGVDFFDFDITYDKYIGDHNPKFEITMKALNNIIFSFQIYNIWHTNHLNSPYYGKDTDDTFEMVGNQSYRKACDDGVNYEIDNPE